MKTLDEIALSHGTDKASSHHDYCRVYDLLFTPLRDKPMALLEIGCQFGFSARAWLDYFNEGEIYTVDLLEQFKSGVRFHFVKGDIGDVAFWKAVPWPVFDIIIDDGPHIFESSIVALDCLWGRLKPRGWYIIEDLPCWWDANYQRMYGGENPERYLKMAGWFIRLLGNLNQNGKSYFGKPTPVEPLSGMETEIEYVHFYRGLLIIRKK